MFCCSKIAQFSVFFNSNLQTLVASNNIKPNIFPAHLKTKFVCVCVFPTVWIDQFSYVMLCLAYNSTT